MDTAYGLNSTERVFEICSGATRSLAYILNDFALLGVSLCVSKSHLHSSITEVWHLIHTGVCETEDGVLSGEIITILRCVVHFYGKIDFYVYVCKQESK